MSRKIVVTSNCQTAGVVQGLHVFLPGTSIRSVNMARTSTEAGTRELADELESADAWVTALAAADIERLSGDRNDLSIIRIPIIRFAAFHPDQVYVVDSAGRPLRGTANISVHSAITFWCYANGINLERCVGLFNDNVFSRLGYLDLWDRNFAALKKNVAQSDIDFDDFMLPVLRSGIFMHTNNHPTIEVLIELSRQIARRIEPHAGRRTKVAPIPDNLATRAIWPVYPPIADQFGEPGSYVWRLTDDDYANCVEDFVARTYQAYDEQDISGFHCPARGEEFAIRMREAVQ